MKFTKVNDGLPEYGMPVLLRIKGVIQDITYILDGFDTTPDWFEPFHFESDGDLKLYWNEADEWMYMRDLRELFDDERTVTTLEEDAASWRRVSERLEGENQELRRKVSDLIKILENVGAIK